MDKLQKNEGNGIGKGKQPWPQMGCRLNCRVALS